MAVNIPGIIGIVLFYLLILVVGLIAGRKGKRKTVTKQPADFATQSDDLFLANRGLGLFVASFTNAATMVGGAYINGTAETMGRDGMKKYGNKMGGLLFFPEFCGDLFWEAAILAALACVAVFYTFFGGLYSVAYTDVIQLFCIAGGLILALPFAATNVNVDLSKVKSSWKGTMPTNQIARNSSLIGVIISLLLAVPPAAIGVIGAATDWNATEYQGNVTLTGAEWSMVLPMVLQYLCPVAVSVIGIGAVSAAVMSSADSIVLGVGSVFARNIYRNIFRLKASDQEIVWVLRISIIAVGALGALIAITVKSVYGLYILCGDLMFVIQFPQLTCALWIPFSNTYGCASGYIVGLLLRILGGEPVLKIPAIIHYPFYTEEYGQIFPFKTLSMIICFTTIVTVSYITDVLFKRQILSKSYDIFNCFGQKGFEKQEMEIQYLGHKNEATPGDALLKR
ncbi:hypothetical protein KUTeg_020003 [Tegillarca granosa]|uniref:High-affinity choline transporter 1 n=1 Tax=Tegillarca granosa TaxID=220873 RepID=A0ABQ9EE72_TEGGR|nr:hypothetical protein KUTeg_020003 [Tegillarca granosa]